MRIVAENHRVTALHEEERIAFGVLQERGWQVNGFEAKLPVFLLVSVPGLADAASSHTKAAVETTLSHSRRALKYAIAAAFLLGLVAVAAMSMPHKPWEVTVRILGIIGSLELVESTTRKLLLHRVSRALQNDGQA